VHRVLITTPLAPELVERVRTVDPRLDVVYPEELIASPRFASDHPFPTLDAPGAAERWEELLDEAEILFDPGPLALGDRLAARPRLRWLQSSSAGVGRLAEGLGLLDSDVVVTTASGPHDRPLAEFALMATIMFGKRTLECVHNQRERRWADYTGEEVRGKTVCVVGLGRIGREVARLHRLLDARVVGTVRELRGRTAADLGVERLEATDALDELLREADVVVLVTPHTEETHRLLDARRIALLKPSAVLINIARGDVVDEEALVEALRDGRLRGAALDVFQQEPLPPESPFWTLPNVLVSPHSAADVPEESERVVEIFVDNLRRYLDGRPLRNVLDKQLLY
jgi:phosphoglycerate dehydrogenase-like enzyme